MPWAAPISAADSLSEVMLTLARSNLLVSSTSAASPRLRTSAMMPRTLAATYSAPARLCDTPAPAARAVSLSLALGEQQLAEFLREAVPARIQPTGHFPPHG